MGSPKQGAQRLRRVADRLARLAERVESEEAERSELDTAVAEIFGTQRDLFGPRPRSPRGSGAKARILDYLRSRLGRPVYGEELAAVSGIQEWPRRVRELRVQDGYDIVELGHSTYRLESATPDRDRAAQWKVANEIRKRPGSARKRIKDFLAANVGEVVTREQIDYVSKIAEGSRRVRELRDEFGWPINSHIDEPDLDPGEYRLLSTDPADRRDSSQRLYSEDLRQRVFERDDYTCRICNRDRAKALAAGDTRFYLEVHHKIAVADELVSLSADQLNDMSNLMTVCHGDHHRLTTELQKQRRLRRRKR